MSTALAAVAQRQHVFLDRGLQLHAALGQLGQGLRGGSRNAPDLQFVQPRELVLDAAPPDLGRSGRKQYSSTASALLQALARVCPRAGRPRSTGASWPVKSRSETSGSSGVGQAGAKGQRAVAVALGLQLVGVERQRHQAHHHAFVGLARMARQRQRMVGVVAVVDVGNLQVGLEDGGFEGHAVAESVLNAVAIGDHCRAGIAICAGDVQTRRASSAALPM